MTNFSRAGLAVLSLTALFLVACETRSALQTKSDAYIRANISSLSPRSAQAGATFEVTKIEWTDEDSARVTYGDGKVELIGTTDITLNGDVVSATRFRIQTNNSSSSSKTSMSSNSSMSAMSSSMMSNGSSMSSVMMSSGMSSSMMMSSMSSMSSKSSMSSMPSSTSAMSSSKAAGAFCGGIAGVMCPSGYRCQLDGTYPDAGGVCVK